MPHELDVVRFRVPIDGWPAGTTGTVLLGYSQGGLVEVSSHQDQVSVDYADVEVVWSAKEAASCGPSLNRPAEPSLFR